MVTSLVGFWAAPCGPLCLVNCRLWRLLSRCQKIFLKFCPFSKLSLQESSSYNTCRLHLTNLQLFIVFAQSQGFQNAGSRVKGSHRICLGTAGAPTQRADLLQHTRTSSDTAAMHANAAGIPTAPSTPTNTATPIAAKKFASVWVIDRPC